MVLNEQIRPDHVPYEKYQELLEERDSLKNQVFRRGEQIKTLEGLLALKDKELVRLKDQLHLRDATLNKLRATIDQFAWAESSNVVRRNSEASPEEKHEIDPAHETIDTNSVVMSAIGMENQDGKPLIYGESPPLLSTTNGPALPTVAKQDNESFVSAPIQQGEPLSCSTSGPPLRPPLLRPPRPDRPKFPPTEANITGATPSPVHESRSARPPHREVNITGAIKTPIDIDRSSAWPPLPPSKTNITKPNPITSSMTKTKPDGKPKMIFDSAFEYTDEENVPYTYYFEKARRQRQEKTKMAKPNPN